jgi:hypothetical protein
MLSIGCDETTTPLTVIAASRSLPAVLGDGSLLFEPQDERPNKRESDAQKSKARGISFSMICLCENIELNPDSASLFVTQSFYNI